jgi:hypothetical protein
MKLLSGFRPNRRAVLASAASLVASQAIAERAIPDDNLAYPVMVTLKLRNGATSFGSAFYLNSADATYLLPQSTSFSYIRMEHFRTESLS